MPRTVVRNSFARQSIVAERVQVLINGQTCAECGGQREYRYPSKAPRVAGWRWLYRFSVDDDQGPRQSGPIAGGKLFCSRECCETYTGQKFDETEG